MANENLEKHGQPTTGAATPPAAPTPAPTSDPTSASAFPSPAERLRTLAATARDRASGRVTDAVDAARARVGDAQAIVADRLEAGARVVRGPVRGARRRRGVGALRSRLGDTMESAAYGLRSRDVTELGAVIADATRANPRTALLVAFGLGAATALVVRASLTADDD